MLNVSVSRFTHQFPALYVQTTECNTLNDLQEKMALFAVITITKRSELLPHGCVITSGYWTAIQSNKNC